MSQISSLKYFVKFKCYFSGKQKFTVQNDCLAWLLFSLCFSGSPSSILKKIGDEVSLSHQIGSKNKMFYNDHNSVHRVRAPCQIAEEGIHVYFSFLSILLFDVFLWTVPDISHILANSGKFININNHKEA